MTDPTFDTREALEAWINRRENTIATYRKEQHPLNYILDLYESGLARVRAAHSHLLKGNDDA